jgi:hypothetical protein
MYQAAAMYGIAVRIATSTRLDWEIAEARARQSGQDRRRDQHSGEVLSTSLPRPWANAARPARAERVPDAVVDRLIAGAQAFGRSSQWSR